MLWFVVCCGLFVVCRECVAPSCLLLVGVGCVLFVVYCVMCIVCWSLYVGWCVVCGALFAFSCVLFAWYCVLSFCGLFVACVCFCRLSFVVVRCLMCVVRDLLDAV